MRVVYDNTADLAVLTASSSAGSLVANNLKTKYKAEVWRTTSTTASLTLQWVGAKIAGCLALVHSNMSSAGTIRIRCYTAATDSSPAYDSGVQIAVPPSSLGTWAWGSLPLGINAYAYGGLSYIVKWFPQAPYEKIVVDLVDAANPSSYMEFARLICGAYQSFSTNPDWGIEIGYTDNSSQYRNDGSDMLVDRGIMFKTMKFALSNMRESDKVLIQSLQRNNAKYRPLLISIFPENTDTALEQMYQIYATMNNLSALVAGDFNKYQTSIELEEN